MSRVFYLFVLFCSFILFLRSDQVEDGYSVSGYSILELHEDGASPMFHIKSMEIDGEFLRVVLDDAAVGRIMDASGQGTLTIEIHHPDAEEPEVHTASFWKRCVCAETGPKDLRLVGVNYSCSLASACGDEEVTDMEFFFILRILVPGEELGISVEDPAGPDSIWMIKKE